MCGCKQGTCPGSCPCGCRHTPPTPRERLAKIVAGIDQDEGEHPEGWWPTSDGVEFKTGILEQLQELVDEPTPDPADDYRRRAALFNDITYALLEHDEYFRLSDRQAIADHLWAQGWRRDIRPEDINDPAPTTQQKD